MIITITTNTNAFRVNKFNIDLNDVDIENYYYITVTNATDQIRLFYNTAIESSDNKANMIRLLSGIKEKFSNYSYDFIIEAFMRVSNNIDDLQSYLSDPLKYNCKQLFT